MKSFVLAAVAALSVVAFSADDAWAQRGGGGGPGGGGMGGGGGCANMSGMPSGMTASSGMSIGSPLLNSYVSPAQSLMMQQMQQAYWQQQAAIAAQKAQRAAELKAASIATQTQRRQSELARRASYREFLTNSANK